MRGGRWLRPSAGRAGYPGRGQSPPSWSGGLARPLAVCVALAAASLVVPSTPTYDPWLWLSWGREVAALELDTRAFGSWKPLPVLFTAPLSLLGDAAPALWLVVTRTAGLLAMLLAYRLAARLAGRAAGALAGRAAGALAVGALVLAPDPAASWVYYLAHGTSETLVAAAVLLAVLRGLDGHHGQALALGALAGLGRPEAWPLLALYGGWLWRAAPHRRVLAAGLAALLAALWLGGDLWGAGSALRGAEAARGGGGLTLSARHLATAALTAAQLLVAPAWPAAAYAAWRRGGAGGHPERLLAGGALAWIATVIALGGLHFSAQARFMTPAAAVLAALAGTGAVRAAARLRAVRSPAARRAAAGVLLAAATAATVPRVVVAAEQLPAAAGRAAIQRDLAAALSRAGGQARLGGCPPLAVQNVAGSYTAAAWRLGIRPSDVRWLDPGERPDGGVAVVYGRPRRPAPYGGRVLAGAGRWLVVAVRC